MKGVAHQRIGFAKIATGIFGFLAALATFEPRVENLEFIPYGLYAFLPEFTLLAGLGLLILALRAGFLSLVARHWRLLGAITLTIGFIAWNMAETKALESSGARRQDLKVYADGFRSPLRRWARNRRHAYSWLQTDLFRRDMRVRAAEAFRRYDFAGSAAYLRAARTVLPDEMNGYTLEESVNYLSARQRYLDNHRARIAALAKTSPMAPLRLYMMRVVARLESEKGGGDPELGEAERRVRAAFGEAQRAIHECLTERRMHIVGPDARAFVTMVSETMGGFPAFGPAADPVLWCRALRGSPIVQEVDKGGFEPRFTGLAVNLWGEALVEPAQRFREEEIEPAEPEPATLDDDGEI